ncbi:ACP S-malonyltransferase [Criblamydia sequanensis]|uniref:Malonyl CoA-acyl carrier protein transacylase n=1 Tax=Candidatus Criblamydia sequanensis CRIB-18 TaxID=1437425 RepID=A0A090CZ09_9BACT|nr:ACP S-malonyltransferase [Criblamydia sequanensis]CDR33901.1 Malonyl CoA-acyl carrier protein transacylase [Criblamydia sequanensis CRIB-18]
MVRAKKIAFIFPGQGAQYPGMAKDFFEHYAVSRETFEEADDILGRKISDIILRGPENILVQTRNSQTGIFIASAAILRALKFLFPDFDPAFTAGLSLGEYTALYAGSFSSFEETLTLVQRRGRYMNDACEEEKGTMAVVLGIEPSILISIVQEVGRKKRVSLANFNCPGQIVISGTLDGVEEVSNLAKQKGAKRILPLSVHGAFHSVLMKSAEDRLEPHIKALQLRKGLSELVMNVTGAIAKSPEEIKSNLIKQVTSSVLWEQSIETMRDNQVDLFVEIGPGKTLAGFNKRIGVLSPTLSIERLSDLELLAEYQ